MNVIACCFIRSVSLLYAILPNSVVQAQILPPASKLTGQVVPVTELSDVQPTDWAFQALRALMERYGVMTGYPNSTFSGNRAMTRYEFAAGLQAASTQIRELLATGAIERIPEEDLAVLERLQNQFITELATLRDRIDGLEAKTAALEANQFSTTTRLTGQAIFAVSGGGFDGDEIVSSTGEDITTDDPNITSISRVALDLDTSFTGTDLLKIRIDAGSGGTDDNTAGLLEPNFGSGLDFSSKPPSDGDIGLARLYYSFNPVQNLTVAIGPDIRTTDYVDLNQYANLSFRDFSTEALVNNILLFPVNGPSAGAFTAWNPGKGNFTIRGLYAAAEAGSADERSFIRGAAPFTRLLYPAQSDDLTGDSSGERGLFGDTYQGTIELEYTPSTSFAIRLDYSGGEVFERRFDVFGVNAEWRILEQVAIVGRYGYGSYDDTAFGDVNPNYWMAGVTFLDLFAEGAFASIAAGQPFIATEVGDATQTNFEMFYSLPINEYIQLTPLIQVITDAGNQNDNGTIWSGSVRTVFSF